MISQECEEDSSGDVDFWKVLRTTVRVSLGIDPWPWRYWGLEGGFLFCSWPGGWQWHTPLISPLHLGIKAAETSHLPDVLGIWLGSPVLHTVSSTVEMPKTMSKSSWKRRARSYAAQNLPQLIPSFPQDWMCRGQTKRQQQHLKCLKQSKHFEWRNRALVIGFSSSDVFEASKCFQILCFWGLRKTWLN